MSVLCTSAPTSYLGAGLRAETIAIFARNEFSEYLAGDSIDMRLHE